MEQFRELPGYGGRFLVGDAGTVKTTPYVDAAGKNRRGRTIRPSVNRHGHLMIRLCYEGHVFTTGAHRLMLRAWVREPAEGEEACHRNDVPDDNRLDNLYWRTRTHNMRDAVRNGGGYNTKRTHCKHGHPLSGANVYTPPGRPTWRVCVACRNRRARQNT